MNFWNKMGFHLHVSWERLFPISMKKGVRVLITTVFNLQITFGNGCFHIR